MFYNDNPDGLNLENRSDLSTEEIIQIASQMPDGDILFCITPITSKISLVLHLSNKPAEGVVVRLHITGTSDAPHLEFHLRNVHVKPPRRRSSGNRICMDDIITIFDLDDSTKWRLCGGMRGSLANKPI